jgi:integrase
MKNELRLNTINFSQATEDFITYLDVNEETLRCYKEGIKKFLGYLKNIEVKYPTRNEVRTFREYLAKEHSIYTVNGYLTALRRFFAYLEDNNLYENITKSIKSLKTSSIPVRQTLSEEECKTIYKSLTDKREKLIFSLCVSTGLRANEVALAKIENIKIYNGEVVLFVKCKKRDDESEYVKLSDEVLNDINNYIENRTNGYIFISTSNNNNGGGLTNTSIRNIVKGIFRRFGYDEKGFSCHSLRRTSATLMYEAGQNLNEIKQVLHHNSVQTTIRYVSQITRKNNESEKIVSKMLFSD